MQNPDSWPARGIVPVPILQFVAALVAAASLVSGVTALRKDVLIAFRFAGPSTFPASVSRQIEAVSRQLPPGASVLLVSTSFTDGSWYTRLFQRALYPRNPVIVRYLPLTRAETDSLRRQWSIHHAIAMGTPPPDPGFLRHEDLGALPAMPDRVWFGELAP